MQDWKKGQLRCTLYQIPSSEMTQNKPENSKTGSEKMPPKCDQEGHTKQSKQCPQKKTHENKDRSDASPPAGRKNALPTCSSCGQVGHTKRSKDCPLNSTSEQESNVSIHSQYSKRFLNLARRTFNGRIFVPSRAKR